MSWKTPMCLVWQCDIIHAVWTFYCGLCIKNLLNVYYSNLKALFNTSLHLYANSWFLLLLLFCYLTKIWPCACLSLSLSLCWVYTAVNNCFLDFVSCWPSHTWASCEVGELIKGFQSAETSAAPAVLLYFTEQCCVVPVEDSRDTPESSWPQNICSDSCFTWRNMLI